MNALVKVLVVIVLVLSLVFAGAEIALYAKRENYGKKYIEEAKARADTQANLDKAKQELTDTHRTLDTLKEKTDKEILDLNTSLANEKARELELTKENGQLNTSVQGLTETTKGLGADLAARDQTIEGLRGAVSQRDQTIKQNLDKIDALQKTVAEKDASIADLDAKLTDAKKQLTKVTESENQLNAIIAELVQRGVQVPPAPLPIIDGRIVGVNKVSDKISLAAVDKGAKAGVKPNTQFVVYRDSQYVGRLIIDLVQPDMASGRMDRMAPNQQVAPGDDATTRIQ